MTEMSLIVTLIKRFTSRNRRVIEDFGGVFVLSRCILDLSVGVDLHVEK